MNHEKLMLKLYSIKKISSQNAEALIHPRGKALGFVIGNLGKGFCKIPAQLKGLLKRGWGKQFTASCREHLTADEQEIQHQF